MKKALLASLTLTAPFALAAPGDGFCESYSLAFSKDTYQAGEPAVLTVTGLPGTISWLGFDPDPGPTAIPGLGLFNLGFSNSFLFSELAAIPEEGSMELTWSCDSPCVNPITGTDIYIQGVALDPITMELCISNPVVLNVEDELGICGSEGCTPGYWKNHTEAWHGLAPGDDWDTVFGVDYHNPDQTLWEALDPAGGDWTFAAHAVAALLNANDPDVDYALSPEEVILMVQEAAMGSFADQEATKDILATANEAGCPL